MTDKGRDLLVSLGRFDQRQVRFFILILTLILFLLTGGAPETSGDCGGC